MAHARLVVAPGSRPLSVESGSDRGRSSRVDLDKISAEPARVARQPSLSISKDYGARSLELHRPWQRGSPLLDAWNKSHGGRLKIWCAEFGCYQRTVRPEDRYQYLRDVRTAFETYNIGWAYWSYNETLTVMTPDRTPFGPADRQTPDQRLLQMLK